ncbi:phosphoadenosine phosphosulfate reductase family protein [Lachnospiraceae bacterium 54-11]
MDKPEYNLVSFSGGKDSTAMLLGMIERGMRIDCILFCDTGLEFPAMYEHIAKLEKDTGMPITRVQAEKSFEELMFYAEIKRKPDSAALKKYGPDIRGYGWAGPRMRWCTARLKDEPREKFLREIRKEYDVKEYVGIASDEGYRLERKRNRQDGHVHPLVDWGMTEADCLQYCYDHGYDWNGLYGQFKRVSCWCCPLQPLPELRQLYHNHRELWEQLKAWDKMTWRSFRADYSVEELEIRFDFEDEWQKAGKPIKGRAFFNALKERLEEAGNGEK